RPPQGAGRAGPRRDRQGRAVYVRQGRGRSYPVIALNTDAADVLDSGEVRERGHATDATLRSVALLGNLQELSLDGAHVTDAGLAQDNWCQSFMPLMQHPA